MAVLNYGSHRPMNISLDFRQAEFLTSAHTLAQLPVDKGREVAFAGRSNSGKSSVLNLITDHKGLARISRTPGRTRTMNCYALGEAIRLVDLPGYGYAKVPRNLREYWDKTMNNYLSTRGALAGLVLITDIRRELCDSDRLLLEWCQAVDLPVHVLLNKADKMSRGAAHGVLHKIKKGSKSREVSVQLFSVLQKTGIDELRHWITNRLLDRR